EGADLPPDARLPEGDGEAQGLDRAALRRGEGLARPAPVPAAGIGQREHRRVAGRHRPEPQAVLGRDRVGAAPRPVREPRGPPRAFSGGRNRLRLIDGPAAFGRRPCGGTGPAWAFFNTLPGSMNHLQYVRVTFVTFNAICRCL